MNTTISNIYLVGMPGAGKTTIGRQLARRLQRRFVDVDHEIETRTGVRIPVIFDIEGEQGFRDRESRTLTELAAETDLVVATGGGAVLRRENRELLSRSGGVVVYLEASPATIFERTSRDGNRPLLQVADPRAKVDELFRVRDPLYREVADIVIPVAENGGVTRAVRLIEKELQARCAA